MRAEAITPPATMRPSPRADAEFDLLDLFAPTRASTVATASPPRIGHAALWRADAIHRAKNMAQMASSLASVANHPSRCWLPPEVIAKARCLSRAYEELGIDDDASARLPCAALLTDIANRLADIFGRSRNVKVAVVAEALPLPPDERRALLLMGSELIINALKYGYAAGIGGTISVGLAARGDGIALTVADDGIGLTGPYVPGHGSGLLEQLAAVLGATVTRAAGANAGMRVTIWVPPEAARGRAGTNVAARVPE